MKSIVKLISLSLMLAISLWSCTKDENKEYIVSGTKPVLTASTTTLPLSFVNASNEAIKFSWTNPNYLFTTGVSSQDVSYLIEIDTTGANFTNPAKQSVSVSKELSVSITVSTFNDYLLNQLQLVPGMPHNLDVRVTASMAGGTAPLVSNVVKLVATPYAIPPKVAPPVTGKLYIVGNATAGGWNNPVPVPTQEFTQVSATLYEITVPLVGGQEYLFLPLNGDWGSKYAVKDKTLTGLNAGGDFAFNANDNFPGPSVSGNYKISVDFQRGKFVVTKL